MGLLLENPRRRRARRARRAAPKRRRASSRRRRRSNPFAAAAPTRRRRRAGGRRKARGRRRNPFGRSKSGGGSVSLRSLPRLALSQGVPLVASIWAGEFLATAISNKFPAVMAKLRWSWLQMAIGAIGGYALSKFGPTRKYALPFAIGNLAYGGYMALPSSINGIVLGMKIAPMTHKTGGVSDYIAGTDPAYGVLGAPQQLYDYATAD